MVFYFVHMLRTMSQLEHSGSTMTSDFQIYWQQFDTSMKARLFHVRTHWNSFVTNRRIKVEWGCLSKSWPYQWLGLSLRRHATRTPTNNGTIARILSRMTNHRRSASCPPTTYVRLLLKILPTSRYALLTAYRPLDPLYTVNETKLCYHNVHAWWRQETTRWRWQE